MEGNKMTKRILLLTIFAMPTLFGASSSNNNQVVTKGDFELLAQDFMKAVQHKNAAGALEIHKKMQSKFRRSNRVEIVKLIDTPAFRGLILHEADNNRNIKQFFDCYAAQHPIARQIRANNLAALREQYKQEQQKIKQERQANAQKLIEAQEHHNALEKAKQEFLNQIALYEYAPNKDEFNAQLLSAYNHIQSTDKEAARRLVESLQFRKLFEQLIQKKDKRGLEILNKLYNNNDDLMQLADPILYPAQVAPQNMTLFDDMNYNTLGGITQPQTTATQTDLDAAIQESILTAQQEQQRQKSSNSDLSDDDDSDNFPSSSLDQHNKQKKHDRALSQEEQNIQLAMQLSQQQTTNNSTSSNLNDAKQLAGTLLSSKISAGQILHIQNTVTEIAEEIKTTHTLSDNEQLELRKHIDQLLNNDEDDDSLDDTQLQQQVEPNNNASLFVGGAITTGVIAGIIFLFSKK